VTTAGDAAVDRAAAAPTWLNGVPEPSETPGYPNSEHGAEPVFVKSMFWYTDPAAPSEFTTVARRSFVAQPATPPAAFGVDAVAGVEADPEAPEAPEEAAPEAADDGAAAAEEAEEAVPAGGAEDDVPPDEQPATAATTAPAATAPPSLSIPTEPNMVDHSFPVTGLSPRASTGASRPRHIP
jgi:hypothetical protein